MQRQKKQRHGLLYRKTHGLGHFLGCYNDSIRMRVRTHMYRSCCSTGYEQRRRCANEPESVALTIHEPTNMFECGLRCFATKLRRTHGGISFIAATTELCLVRHEATGLRHRSPQSHAHAWINACDALGVDHLRGALRGVRRGHRATHRRRFRLELLHPNAGLVQAEQVTNQLTEVDSPVPRHAEVVY